MNYLTANVQVDFTLPRFCLDYQILIFKTWIIWMIVGFSPII